MAVHRPTSYRFPTEQGILFITCIAVLLVILLTAELTLRICLVVIAGGMVLTYISNRARHAQLLMTATLVNEQSAPALTSLSRECVTRIGSGAIQLFIARSRELNAYTFGFQNPKIVVLHSALFNEMDADEIRFVLGHELGHICLGHTWLNSIVGGMAGLPSTFLISSLLRGVFLWWNRACEYSADRAGLLVCRRLDKALSALAKLTTGPVGDRDQADWQPIVQGAKEDADDPGHILREITATHPTILATHPTILHRMNALRNYASTAQYRRLKIQFDQDV